MTLTETPGLETMEPREAIGYRDYLRGLWEELQKKYSAVTADQALQRLSNRFHQDFTTQDVTAAPANEILIPILKRILADAKPTGFGMPSASIPARLPGQDARDYLNTLIHASGVTAIEFSLRFRLDLTRPDGATSSPVEENIATLRGIFRDSFQSVPDPFQTPPGYGNAPVIQPDRLNYRAPFFLEYDEWVDQSSGTFYPENFFSMVRSLHADDLEQLAQKVLATKPPTDKWYGWYQKVAAFFNDVQKAIGYLSTGEYALALPLLEDTKRGADELIYQRVMANPPDEYSVVSHMDDRQALTVTDKPSLLKFEDLFASDFTGAMALYAGYFYYVWRSDALLSLNRFPEAAYDLLWLINGGLGAASQDDHPGYGYNDVLYTDGSLPYTWTWAGYPGGYLGEKWITSPGFPAHLHTIDKRFVQLRLGNVLLEWADALYRTDEASLNARARELYKAVLWLHGDDPGVSPAWDVPPTPKTPSGNIAVVGQIAAARAGFIKSNAGLNYFGLTNDTVPVQRYRTLKDLADQYAGLAVAAEHDFLVAMENLEQLSIDDLRTSNMLAKAQAQRTIADEQGQIAAYNVAVAKLQVSNVQSQIAAKAAEIADHDSFFGQWSDFISGASKTATSVFKDLKSTPAGDVAGQITSGVKAELGYSSASSAGLLGLGTAASVLAGYGLFVYVGYTTLSSMASAAEARQAQLEQLQNVTLPLAEANVTAREREVTITRLQANIAAADIQLAQDLLSFNEQRLLNSEFWAAVAGILQRVLRRYIDLATWAAWLAERALAFEQNRQVRIIRMDYLVPTLRNVTGAELLQSDLAELDATRTAGERVLVPFTYSMSLVEDFPLAFGALKAHGACTFSTREAALRTSFPGTYGHRIRDARVAVRTARAGARVRGTLTNQGVSLATVDDTLNARALLRLPDAIALSETSSGASPDPQMVDLLAPFEGSGLDTTWTLQLDPAASGGAWDSIVDIIIDIEGRASYSDSLRQVRSIAAATAEPADRFVMMSARTFAKDALDALRDNGAGDVTLDLRDFPFPIGELSRTVSNVAVLLPGAKGKPVTAKLHLDTSPPRDTNFAITDGIALSNGQPLRLRGSTTPASPLNAVIGAPVAQPWSIQISASPGADLTGVVDLILGIDYTANKPASAGTGGRSRASADRGISALARSKTQMEVFWVAPGGEVRHAWFFDGQDPAWPVKPLTAAHSASEQTGVTAVSRQPDTIEALWVGPTATSELQDASFFDGQKWKTNQFGTGVSPSPTGGVAAVCPTPKRIASFWRTVDGALFTTFWDGTDPHPIWRTIKVDAGTATDFGDTRLAALSRADNHREAFYLTPQGAVKSASSSDGQVWQTATLTTDNAASLQTGIGAVSRAGNHMEIFWVDPYGAVKHAWFYDGQDPVWQVGEIVGPASAATGTGIGAVSRAENHMEIFWVNSYGAVKHAWFYDDQEPVWQTGEIAAPGSAVIPQN